MEDQNCDCCEGTQALTPASVANRPGLSALSYRVGTHARFLQTMKARLSNLALEITDPADGSTATAYPLSDLTTRAANDPAIALMDSWAMVADVLTFYQERIANEGFLGTATERRSVLELARLIGYALRPGVSASAFLALDLDSGHNVVIQPHEVKAQTVPGHGELPQVFETCEVIETRAEWNRLQPRLTKPQNITLDNVQIIPAVYFKGGALNLKPGDRILFVFGEAAGEQAVRRVKQANAQFENNRTEVVLQEVPFLVVAAVILLRTALAALTDAMLRLDRSKLTPKVLNEMELVVNQAREALKKQIENLLLGNYPPLSAEFFSHDRIYDFLAGQTGMNRAAVAAPFNGVNNFLRRAAPEPEGVHGAAAAAAAAAPNPLQELAIAVAHATLDRALQMLGDKAFTHELACLASGILTQARPASAKDTRFLTQLLNRFGDSANFKSLRANLIQLPALIGSYPELSDQIQAILRAFTQITASAEVFDAANHLLDDLIALAPVENVLPLLQAAQDWLKKLGKGPANVCEPVTAFTTVDELVLPLAKLPPVQLASSAFLKRFPKTVFNARADIAPKMMLSFTPRLGYNLYRAWANAAVNPAPAPLKSAYVLRAEAVPFGYNAPVKMGLTPNNNNATKDKFPFLSEPDGDWSPTDAGDEKADTLFLDTANSAILPRSYILIHNKNTGSLLARVNAAQTRPRTAYTISSKTTQLTVSRDWWDPASDSMDRIRNTVLAAQSEELFLVDQPYTVEVQGATLELGDLYDGLTTGRWLIVSGERTDIANTSGVKAVELAMIAGVDQQFDASLPGDRTRTVITLANALAYRYKRDSVVIYGNVVKANHGETRKETLGSGDASQAFQAFLLKQAPLTYTSSPTPAGAESSLAVYVNDVRWYESDSLIGLAPTDRNFVTKTDDAAKTTVTFGNGQNGARLPTAPSNIRAEYRNGIGRPGNVQSGKISLLMSKPVGVQAVVNPLPTSGGADRESRDTARKNAPRTVTALDRLVSVSDYADFSRTFAGIGKSAAARLNDRQRSWVHVTIAGADDIPIDDSSDLYHNLLLALRSYGDSDLPVFLQTRELLLLVISANLHILPDYQWDPVVKAVRARLLDIFGFEKRELGQVVYLSEVISAIQGVAGVDYVDVDVLGGVPEKLTGKDAAGRPIRRLLTPSEIADEALGFVAKSGKTGLPQPFLPVNLAGFEGGALRPAQLAYLSPDVPDTLVLNQVK